MFIDLLLAIWPNCGFGWAGSYVGNWC